jgi:hypothetical protein
MRTQSFAVMLIVAGLSGTTALPVQAATNISRPITSTAGEAACVKAGGTVVAQARQKVCSIRSVAASSNPQAKQLCGNPDGSSSCCKAWGGTWVTGGSDGFCYRYLPPD